MPGLGVVQAPNLRQRSPDFGTLGRILGAVVQNTTMGLSVLLVDDDSEFRESLRDLLAAEGCRVVCARDGSDAVAAMRAHKPQVVILDYVMPRVDGAGLVKTLRQSDATSDIAIVMMSGLPEDMVRPVCEGYDVYLPKPVDIDTLMAALHRALALRRSQA
jgi:CheY-like chemotaxis protein